jgi:hypothetical protein
MWTSILRGIGAADEVLQRNELELQKLHGVTFFGVGVFG